MGYKGAQGEGPSPLCPRFSGGSGNVGDQAGNQQEAWEPGRGQAQPTTPSLPLVATTCCPTWTLLTSRR